MLRFVRWVKDEVSTKQQDMEQQQANIDFYCRPENFNLEVVETFLFPGTGGDVVTKTAEFKRMLQALVNGPDVVGVVFSQLDRMMRPWLPDGKSVAFSAVDGLLRFDLEEWRPSRSWNDGAARVRDVDKTSGQDGRTPGGVSVLIWRGLTVSPGMEGASQQRRRTKK